jgi:protein-tyrosine phosphatase
MEWSATVSTLGHKLRQTLWRVDAHFSRSSSERAAPRSELPTTAFSSSASATTPLTRRGRASFAPSSAELGVEGRVRVESAGKCTSYEGRSPHRYARREALRRGVDIGGHRARGLNALDLAAFDLVVAVDERTLRELSSVDSRRLVLLGSFGEGGDIADPNGREGRVFAETHDAIEVACDGFARFVADRVTSTSEMSA